MLRRLLFGTMLLFAALPLSSFAIGVTEAVVDGDTVTYTFDTGEQLVVTYDEHGRATSASGSVDGNSINITNFRSPLGEAPPNSTIAVGGLTLQNGQVIVDGETLQNPEELSEESGLDEEDPTTSADSDTPPVDLDVDVSIELIEAKWEVVGGRHELAAYIYTTLTPEEQVYSLAGRKTLVLVGATSGNITSSGSLASVPVGHSRMILASTQPSQMSNGTEASASLEVHAVMNGQIFRDEDPTDDSISVSELTYIAEDVAATSDPNESTGTLDPEDAPEAEETTSPFDLAVSRVQIKPVAPGALLLTYKVTNRGGQASPEFHHEIAPSDPSLTVVESLLSSAATPSLEAGTSRSFARRLEGPPAVADLDMSVSVTVNAAGEEDTENNQGTTSLNSDSEIATIAILPTGSGVGALGDGWNTLAEGDVVNLIYQAKFFAEGGAPLTSMQITATTQEGEPQNLAPTLDSSQTTRHHFVVAAIRQDDCGRPFSIALTASGSSENGQTETFAPPAFAVTLPAEGTPFCEDLPPSPTQEEEADEETPDVTGLSSQELWERRGVVLSNLLTNYQQTVELATQERGLPGAASFGVRGERKALRSARPGMRVEIDALEAQIKVVRAAGNEASPDVVGATVIEGGRLIHEIGLARGELSGLIADIRAAREAAGLPLDEDLDSPEPKETAVN